MVKKGGKEQFTSRWGLILAALGAAVGTGNIWRFPKEVASNGGSAFILIYLLFLFSWSIPLLIAEFAIGKKFRKGTIGAFDRMLGKKYLWMGIWMMLVSAAINFYYAVVMGWTVRYFWVAVSGGITKEVDTTLLWDSFISSWHMVVFFQVVSLLAGFIIVYYGVAKGIEKATKFMIPALCFLLVGAMLWSLTLDGSYNGLRYMFWAEWGALGKGETWIRALAQSAWSCSAGMGMGITYAVYMSKKEDIALNSFLTGFGDTAIALVAGIAVICTVFASANTYSDATGYLAKGGTALTFIYLTELFVKMPLGWLIAPMFFLAMAFAALTSLISGMEISTRNFMDFGWSRRKSVTVVTSVTFLLGIPSAVVVLHHKGVPTTAFLDNQDLVWGIGLIVSGFFVAFAIWKYGVSRFREELVNTRWNDLRIGKWWDWVIKFLFPVQFIALFGWYFYQTWMEPSSEWWHKGPTAVIILLLEWGVVMLIAIFLNRRLGEKLDRIKERKDRDQSTGDTSATGKRTEVTPIPTYEIIDFAEEP